MANVYGVNYTALAGSVAVKGSSQVQRGLRTGKVVHIYDYYEAASIAAGTVIYLGPIPLGYRILPGSAIYHDDLGSGVTIKVGDALDDDRYAGATACNAAGIISIPTVAEIDKVPYALASQQGLVLTTAGATATGTIRAFLLCAAA